jgi:phage terminase large subunit-like protein
MSKPNHLARGLADALVSDWGATARPSQLLPPGDWTVNLILAGRGWGKTLTGAQSIRQWVETGRCKRIALVGPTAADVRVVMVEGTSGLLTISPDWNRPIYEPSKRRLTWPNGAIAACFSAEESERLRGPQHDGAWVDELGCFTNADEVWNMLMLGLRAGRNPQVIVTTTPRPTRLLKSLVARAGGDVHLIHGRTAENAANLARPFMDTITARYAGTRLGRQELEGELLDDIVGALWQRDWIDGARVETAPDLQRVVVALDPAVSNSEGADETGLIVAGVSKEGHAYVLADLSQKFQGPHEWARTAANAYRRYQADRVVAEINQGGMMVETTLRVHDSQVSYKGVNASRGKVTRAEPIAALYEQGRVHHVGSFPQLEDQLCSFTSDFDRAKSGYSPDRLDALVWALSELTLGWNPVHNFTPPIIWTKGAHLEVNPSFQGPVDITRGFPG